MWPGNYIAMTTKDFMRDFMNTPIRKKDKLPRPVYGNKSSEKAMSKRKR